MSQWPPPPPPPSSQPPPSAAKPTSQSPQTNQTPSPQPPSVRRPNSLASPPALAVPNSPSEPIRTYSPGMTRPIWPPLPPPMPGATPADVAPAVPPLPSQPFPPAANHNDDDGNDEDELADSVTEDYGEDEFHAEQDGGDEDLGENSTIMHEHIDRRESLSFSDMQTFVSPPPPNDQNHHEPPAAPRTYPLPPGPSPQSNHNALAPPSLNTSSQNSSQASTPTSVTSAASTPGARTYPPLPPGPPPSSAHGPASPRGAFPPPPPPSSSHPPPSHQHQLSTEEMYAPLMNRRQSASASNPNGGPIAPTKAPPSKEEVDTLNYYLRQAIAAKDQAALTDLVARAAEKRISSDLVSQARSMLVDRATEERENEVATLKHYMKQSLASRRAEPIRDVLKKVEPVAAALANGPHRRLHADFFALLDETHTALEELEREDAQTVSAYLRQGVQSRSREVLQAALAKSATVKHSLLDELALSQAKLTLAELDGAVLVKNFLVLAIKNRDLLALEETILQATKQGLSERDTPELLEAKKVLEDLKSSGGSGTKKTKAEKEARALEKERIKQQEKEAKALEKQEAKAEKEKLAAHAQQKDQVNQKTKWFGSGGSKDKDKKSASSSSSSPKSQLFGGSLSEAIRRNPGSSIPRVCEVCIDFLRAHAMQEPGLFRVAGNKDLIDVLRGQFEESFAHDGTDGTTHATEPSLTEIHDVSGLFKLYFRQLPEPLIPYEFYDRFIKVGLNKGSDRIIQLKDLVAQLPRDNIALLDALFRFLSDVSRHSSVNKMSPANLGIVFAPNLVRPKVETPASMMSEMPAGISVVESLIAEYEQIFGHGSSSTTAPTPVP